MKYLPTLIATFSILIITGCSNTNYRTHKPIIDDSPYGYGYSPTSKVDDSDTDDIALLMSKDDYMVIPTSSEQEEAMVITPYNSYFVTPTSGESNELNDSHITPAADRESFMHLKKQCISIGGQIMAKKLDNGMTNFSCNKPIEMNQSDIRKPLHDPA